MDIKVVIGDMTQVEVEVVVTAANRYLAGGGGVDGAVHAAAGPRLLLALHPLGECEPGQAVITPAFDAQTFAAWESALGEAEAASADRR